jgi:5-methyltetrahydrofolate--homocysteine methyltransferase
MADLQALADAIIRGDANAAKALTQQAIDDKVDPKSIIDDGLIAGMAVIGKKFQANEVYVPEMLIAARAMNQAMMVLKPLLVAAGIEPLARVAIGTVKGDLHDIGKNLVLMMLQGAGFEVVDLGVDVPPEKFVEALRNDQIKLLGLSALLTTTMPAMKATIDAITQANLRAEIKIIVGGAPVTQDFADEIGADGYAPDAASAADKAKELLVV